MATYINAFDEIFDWNKISLFLYNLSLDNRKTCMFVFCKQIQIVHIFVYIMISKAVLFIRTFFSIFVIIRDARLFLCSIFSHQLPNC